MKNNKRHSLVVRGFGGTAVKTLHHINVGPANVVQRSRLVLAVLEISLFVGCQRLVKRLRDLLSEAIRCPQCE
jgi:hypothetical protein